MAEAPPNLKVIQPYLKIAAEHDQRDIIVAYWARVFSLQLGIKTAKQPDEKAFLLKIMDWLESVKKIQKENESIGNETVAQAYLENYAHKLFTYADQQDRASNFGKNVVKSFYTAGMLYDIISTFGDLSEEAKQNQKYAKWKAAYIHNCLKNNEQPHPGPLPSEDDELLDIAGGGGQPQDNSNFGWNTGPSQQPNSPPVQPTQQDNGPTNNDPFLNIRAPSPPKDPEEKYPGGFVPYDPQQSNIPIPGETSQGSSSVTADQVIKAQKYCKYAMSSLTYEDVPTAIDYLQKAVRLLQTGQDS